MTRRKKVKNPVIVAAVSGGPDSVYLLHELVRKKEGRIVVGHVNYGTRGVASDKDQDLVKVMSITLGLDKRILLANKLTEGVPSSGGKKKQLPVRTFPSGFEEKARKVRYDFLKRLAAEVKAENIAVAHTADDQIETVLMRIFEGAGIGGLKGIPPETRDGIVRPILAVWKEDIVAYLKKHKIPFRIDASNVDERFERNWVRNVLLPLLVKRYGKELKKRIFTLGERFRELDDYLEEEAKRWIRKYIEKKSSTNDQVAEGLIVFRRKTFSALPSVLRKKILQRICFDRLGVAPNERLLMAMDRSIGAGGPSATVKAGKGWDLVNRYEDAAFLPAGRRKNGNGGIAAIAPSSGIDILAPGTCEYFLDRQGHRIGFVLENRGKVTSAQAKRLAAKGDAEVFDADGLKMPLRIRPLRAGDRIRPFGAGAGGSGQGVYKKVKEILIDRKILRDDRWGRPVVCDAEDTLLWIPGVLRSAHAPVTPMTRNIVLLRNRSIK